MFNKKQFKKVAFVLSLCTFVLWGILGTGASLAWFRDTTPQLKNVFHIAEFDLEVQYRASDGNWYDLEEDSELFKKDALYEPGYTEIVYLKVKNDGEMPFNWHTAVSVYKYTEGINRFGDSFKLQDHLRFGIVDAASLDALEEKVKTRDLVKGIATEVLNNYSTEVARLNQDDERYIAIAVRMPEEVTNEANYVPPHQPEIFLSIIVSASQVID